MAIYERGYRPYEGVFRTTPGWWIVAREGWALAKAHKGVRWIAIIVMLLAAGSCVFLFTQVILTGVAGDFGTASAKLLRRTHLFFYQMTGWLSVLAGVMVGCGLVADDMRSRGLTLYLVRPITRTSYVVGKALILPGVFLVLCLVPGLLLWLLVGLWQPPGETWSFLSDNIDMAERAVGHYLIVTGSMTGVMLLLSSITNRRGVAMASGAAFALLGGVVAILGRLLPGLMGEIGGGLGILRNMLRWLRIAAGETGRHMRFEPTARAVVIVTVAFLFAGLFAVAWRARTTEVGE